MKDKKIIEYMVKVWMDELPKTYLLIAREGETSEEAMNILSEMLAEKYGSYPRQMMVVSESVREGGKR